MSSEVQQKCCPCAHVQPPCMMLDEESSKKSKPQELSCIELAWMIDAASVATSCVSGSLRFQLDVYDHVVCGKSSRDAPPCV